VCGVFFTNSKNNLVLDKISSSLVLRGPDKSSTFIGSDFSIFFTRLAIRDLEGGEQPYTTKDSSSICAINGELYNIEEIRQSLHLSKNSSPTGDMQLLAEYLSLNLSNIKNVRGMFAGFIYNIANKRLSFFRDSVGEKPLYYFFTDGKITVSSTIAAIVEHHGRALFNVNKSSLYKGHSSPGKTIFQEINEVLPGEYIDFDIESKIITKTKYWNWPNRKFYSLSEELDRVFEKCLLEATLVSSSADVPICMLLSGGLDSATVLSALGVVHQTAIPSFTFAFENKSFDESKIAKMSALALDSKHHIIDASNKDIAKYMTKMLNDLDSPILDPAFLPLNYMTERIKKDFGFKVAITGDGGDELFRGYELFKIRTEINLVTSNIPSAFAKKIIRLLYPLFANNEKRNSIQFLLMRLESVLQNREVPWYETALSPYAGTNIFPILSNQVNSKVNPSYSKRKISQEEIEKYYYDEILPQVYLKKSDNGSMANGIELRIPLLHRVMIDFAFSISGKELEINAHKWLIRNYLKEKVPQQVLNQKKHGFSVPLSGILTHLDKPTWNLQKIGLSTEICNAAWSKACQGDSNAARTGFALLVLNRYLLRWD
jgi:asparagine synthase (glutamine-hydrolysing)